MASPNTGFTFVMKVGGQAVGGGRDASFNINGTSVDLTSKDDGGWRNKAAGISDWDGSCAGVVYDTDTAYLAAQTAALGQTTVAVLFTTPEGDNYGGTAIVTGFGESGAYEAEHAYDISVEGTGALLFS